MNTNYVGDQPLGHADAMTASQEWAEPLRGVVAPERFGLAKSALFALFRLTGAERADVFRQFCVACGSHSRQRGQECCG